MTGTLNIERPLLSLPLAKKGKRKEEIKAVIRKATKQHRGLISVWGQNEQSH